MDLLQQKNMFLRGLAADRYDEPLHRVFSDWLEENGYPDEAQFHREWTPEWQKAEDWLRDFADRVGLRYDKVIAAGYKGGDYGTGMNFEPGEWLAGFGDEDFDPEAKTYRGELGYEVGKQRTQAFWTNWEIVTRANAPSGKDKEPFTCCEWEENDTSDWL